MHTEHRVGRRIRPTIAAIGFAIVLLLTTNAWAGPLDLFDPTPRQIEVRFEISPPDEPGRLNEDWSRARTAYLEADTDGPLVEIRIPASEIEAHFRSTGTDPVPGSFSDFRWLLDRRTGHVQSATLSGRVREHFSFGLIRTSALVAISVDMTTQVGSGYRPARGILGLETHPHCDPSRDPRRCIAVRPSRFDPTSGYVNAVGSLLAATPIARVRAFSPLGEVRFSERTLSGDGPDAPQTRSETASNTISEGMTGGVQPDGLCSEEFIGPCPAHLGGES